jgi:hypothetical protein
MPANRVADCSRAGVDYTIRHVIEDWLEVADCSQAGVDYTTVLIYY